MAYATLVEKVCLVCGGVFAPPPTGIKHSRWAARRACSQGCDAILKAFESRPTIEADPLDLAWAAGFYDGEGSVANQHSDRAPTPRIDISQKDRRALDRFHGIVGVGSIRGPYRVANPVFRYYCRGFWKVGAVALALWPHLGPVKREQFARVLDAWFDDRAASGGWR